MWRECWSIYTRQSSSSSPSLLHSINTHVTHLLQPRSQQTTDQELEALQLRLDDDEFEVGLRIHIPRLLFDQLNLPTPLARHAHAWSAVRLSRVCLSRVWQEQEQTYLPSDPLQYPFHELLWPIEYRRRRALRHPQSRQLLQVPRLLRRRVHGNFGEEVVNVHGRVTPEVAASFYVDLVGHG